MYLLFTCPVQLCSWACLSATQEGSLLPRVLRCALIRADSWICSPVLLPITRSFVLIFTSYVLVEQWAVWLSNRRQYGQSPDECKEQGDLTSRERLNRFISFDWGWGDFSDWTMAILALGHSLRWRARILFEWGQASISHADAPVFHSKYGLNQVQPTNAFNSICIQMADPVQKKWGVLRNILFA